MASSSSFETPPPANEEQASSTSAAATREDLVERAQKFLASRAASESGDDAVRAFMQKLGLTEDEIRQASLQWKKASAGATASGGSISHEIDGANNNNNVLNVSDQPTGTNLKLAPTMTTTTTNNNNTINDQTTLSTFLHQQGPRQSRAESRLAALAAVLQYASLGAAAGYLWTRYDIRGRVREVLDGPSSTTSSTSSPPGTSGPPMSTVSGTARSRLLLTSPPPPPPFPAAYQQTPFDASFASQSQQGTPYSQHQQDSFHHHQQQQRMMMMGDSTGIYNYNTNNNTPQQQLQQQQLMYQQQYQIQLQQQQQQQPQYRNTGGLFMSPPPTAVTTTPGTNFSSSTTYPSLSSSAAGGGAATTTTTATATTPLASIAAELDAQRTQFQSAVEGIRAIERDTAASVAELRAMVREMNVTVSATIGNMTATVLEASSTIAATEAAKLNSSVGNSVVALANDVAEMKKDLSVVMGNLSSATATSTTTTHNNMSTSSSHGNMLLGSPFNNNNLHTTHSNNNHNDNQTFSTHLQTQKIQKYTSNTNIITPTTQISNHHTYNHRNNNASDASDGPTMIATSSLPPGVGIATATATGLLLTAAAAVSATTTAAMLSSEKSSTSSSSIGSNSNNNNNNNNDNNNMELLSPIPFARGSGASGTNTAFLSDVKAASSITSPSMATTGRGGGREGGSGSAEEDVSVSEVIVPSATTTTITPESVVAQIHNSFANLASKNNTSALLSGLPSLIMILRNLIEAPHIGRYRRVPVKNGMFERSVASLAGYEECMTSLGFSVVDGFWKWQPWAALATITTPSANTTSKNVVDSNSTDFSSVPIMNMNDELDPGLTASVAVMRKVLDLVLKLKTSQEQEQQTAKEKLAIQETQVIKGTDNTLSSATLAGGILNGNNTTTNNSNTSTTVVPKRTSTSTGIPASSVLLSSTTSGSIVSTDSQTSSSSISGSAETPLSSSSTTTTTTTTTTSTSTINATNAPAALLARARARSRSGSLSAGVGPGAPGGVGAGGGAGGGGGRSRAGSLRRDGGRSRASSRASQDDNDSLLAGLDEFLAASSSSSSSSSSASSSSSSISNVPGTLQDIAATTIAPVIEQVVSPVELQLEPETSATISQNDNPSSSSSATFSLPPLLSYRDVIAYVEAGQTDLLPGIQQIPDALSILVLQEEQQQQQHGIGEGETNGGGNVITTSIFQPVAAAPAKPWEVVGTSGSGPTEEGEQDGGTAVTAEMNSPFIAATSSATFEEIDKGIIVDDVQQEATQKTSNEERSSTLGVKERIEAITITTTQQQQQQGKRTIPTPLSTYIAPTGTAAYPAFPVGRN